MSSGCYPHQKHRAPFSEEWCKNIGLSRKGKPFSGKRYSWEGKHHSEESKRKMSQIAKEEGRRPPGFLGKTLSEGHRKHLSDSHKGKNGKDASNWQGGLTPVNTRIRNSDQFKKWRKAVLERDNYTCQQCDKRGGELNPHHIKSFADFPELRFEVSNGITLCVYCHKLTFKGRSKNYDVEAQRISAFLEPLLRK